MSVTINGTTGIAGVDGSASTPAYQGADTNTGIAFPAADTVSVATGGTERMRVNSSGNVGIGTSSPSFFAGGGLQVSNATQANLRLSDTTNAAYNFDLFMNDADAYAVNRTSGPIVFGTNNTERMRIDSSGNLLVGTASASGLLTCIGSTAAGYAGYFTGNYTASNNANIMFWGRSGGAVAAAVRYKDSGTSMEFYSPTGHTVAYTTSSDYRLKENVAPMTGALATVAQLKPCTYTWKEGFGTGQSQGFIAHELQAVVPDCVTGEKDAVETYTDEEGNEQTRPVYQGVDTSFLVATLTAAIQELSAKNDALEARIAALETQP